MTPVNSGHLIYALRQQLQRDLDNLRPENRRRRRDIDIRLQTVELCERTLVSRTTEPTTRTLAVAILVNLATTYGIEV